MVLVCNFSSVDRLHDAHSQAGVFDPDAADRSERQICGAKCAASGTSTRNQLINGRPPSARAISLRRSGASTSVADSRCGHALCKTTEPSRAGDPITGMKALNVFAAGDDNPGRGPFPVRKGGTFTTSATKVWVDRLAVDGASREHSGLDGAMASRNTDSWQPIRQQRSR